MKRRNFLSILGTGAALPVMMNGLCVRAFASDTPFLSLLANVACEDRILVLVQLAGGNDGLNTVIPLDQYSVYKAVRPNIAVAETAALKLTNATGLHPNMTGMQQLFTQGKLRVVQSVGYPTPDFSHFRSTDIWLTASDYDKIIDTGWLGRWLDTQYPGFPAGYPNAAMPDPVAIQIGNTVSTALEAKQANMGMAFTDPKTYFNINNYGAGTQQNTRFLQELDYIRQTGLQIQNFATPVKNAAAKATNKSSLYPAANQNPLADQLKIVAQLIAGGLRTRIYIVTHSGYDTHSSQNNAGSGTPFSHPQLLQQLSQAISAFQDDLRLLGIEDKVTGMTFSEFGRRIKQNGSNGTDHGAAAPMFIFGSNVQSGILGANPSIPAAVTLEDNIPMQFDFRSVYASLFRDWFCVNESDVKSLLFADFPYLPIMKTSKPTDVNEQGESVNQAKLSVSPNPAMNEIRVRYISEGNPVRISLFDYTGREIEVVDSMTPQHGEHELSIDVSQHCSGNYYCRVSSSKSHSVIPFVIMH
ncbi:MAG: DUF1501 domain-containing protein [Candidatus Kapabacteria bacterium]|nr:DUF1501 domain-containing protein [Candidatus Kapabacteria bacterium]